MPLPRALPRAVPRDVAPGPDADTTCWPAAGRAGVAVLAVLVGALLLAVAAGQVALARVTTGSMAPAVPTGSLVVGRPVGAGDLRVGDLLTARVRAVGGTVTHRVVALARDGGRVVVTTRGDANAAVDPWTTALPDGDATRVVATVPHLGRVLGRGAAGLPLLAVPLLVLVLTTLGCRRLLDVLRASP